MMNFELVASILAAMAVWTFCSAYESPTADAEKYPEYWNAKSREALRISLKKLTTNNKPAKNVILFIGDGMDVTTMTAGRILKGQRYGVSGEESQSSLDGFPHVGLSKVYTLDSQTPDSAGTATALLTGVKTKTKMLGVSGKSEHGNCESSKGQEIKTILENSAEMGKSTGIVTTTHVLHATPASAYAHTPSRGWLNDAHLTPEANRGGCKDIASQLIEQGRKINVVLGGGRVYMRPKGYEDEEYELTDDMEYGRDDERNLIEEWKSLEPSENAEYVWNLTSFQDVKPWKVDHLFGLFEPKHMRYEHDRDNDVAGEPSLAEMTEKALRILRKNEEGFFLLVEGGKIDHAHHDTKANIALSEFLAFDDAVETANRMTDPDDTLIVVTADHGHMFNLGGYSKRGNPIHGFAEDHNAPDTARDGLVYTSIVYGNGLEWLGNKLNKRLSLTETMTKDMEFSFPAAIPLKTETHSASDVAVLARGPMAHLFGGVYEQNYVGYAMMYASCVGPDKRHCEAQGRHSSWQCHNPRWQNIRKFQAVSSSLIRSDERRASNKHLPWWCTDKPADEWVPPIEATIYPDYYDDRDNAIYSQGYTTRSPRGHGRDEVDNVRQRPIPKTAPKRKSWNTTPAPGTQYKRKRWNGTPRPGSANNRATPRPKMARPAGAARRPKVSNNRGTPKPKNSQHATTTPRPRQRHNRGTARPKKAKPTTATNRIRVLKKWGTSNPKKLRSTTAAPKRRVTTRKPKNWNVKNKKQYSRYGSTRPKLNQRRPTPAPHRVFRRELTTERPETVSAIEKYHMDMEGTPETPLSEDVEHGSRYIPDTPDGNYGYDPTERSDTDAAYTAIIIETNSQGRITRNSHSTQAPRSATDEARKTKSPRERFLDLIARAIRAELTHINVFSGDMDPATLDLSIKVSPVYNGDGEDSAEFKGLSENNETAPMVVCMQWSSEAGMVALGPNSSKIAFLYDEDNPNFEKRVAKIATSGGSDQTTVVVLLTILTVGFFLLSVALFYMFRKRSQMLREEIEARERERKAAVMSRIRLQDVEEEEIPRGEYSRSNDNNNSNALPLAKARKAIKSVSRWCENTYDARSVRKTRKITSVSF